MSSKEVKGRKIVSNERLITKMNAELNQIHEDLPHNLPIDSQIRAAIGNHREYTKESLLKLNLDMFLDYSSYLIDHVKTKLKELIWVKTYEFWKEVRDYERIYNEIKNNVRKINLEQITAANSLTYNLNQLAGDLSDHEQDFRTARLKVYMGFLGTSEGALITIYFGLYNNFLKAFAHQTILAYFIFAIIVWVVITIIVYPKFLK